MKKPHMFLTNTENKAGAAQTESRVTRGRAVRFVFNLLLCMLPAAGLMNSSPATAAQTIVSLTFDDGINQSQVADMLLYHGMKGTFYINSNMIGTPGYLTKTELDALVTYGNEIGGHTINHVDLATLTDAEQQAAICNDMLALDAWYPGQIHSFAYPFASTGPTTQSILAAGCPGVGTYTNARTVGGLVSGTQCTACPTAESIPPGNPYYISTPESITSTTTLDEIKTFVTQAENNGGGWVPLVFHQVCDGCDIDSVSAATLDAFLTWLQAREANNTFVRTVNQVMIGDLPPPPPPPPMGPNQLINPSLELDQDANSVADCWARNSNGTNTATWTRTSDAHEGVFAEQLDVTAYSSGDLKLMQILDIGQAFGGCAPTVENGASYQLGAWYKSTTPVTPVVFYQDGGGWQYWQDGPLLPASAGWAQMSFNTGPVPTGAQNISFGIAIQAVGTLTTDDYSMQKILDGADTTAPNVSLTAPAAGTVSGTVTVSAEATDYVGVAGVQFQLDGVNLGAEDTSSPYSVSWDTLTATSGTHALTAVARDAAGNVATSTAVTVTVDNGADTTAPTVSLTAPAAGTVTGTVTVSADAADNFGVVGVQFQLDGANLGAEVTVAPYAVSWDTLTATNGPHTLTAVARDAAGNLATATAVTVTVDNEVPTVSITAPAAGPVSGTVSVTADATDNVGVVGVQFLLDGANLGAEVTVAPYAVSWDTLTATNGTHTLAAVARDAAGNVATATAVTVTVDNEMPTVSLTAPAAGTVTSTVSVTATATDNVGVVGVQFLLDGVNLGAEDTSSPYSVSWDSLTATNGAHTLTAVARDAAGNVATATAVTVTVDNEMPTVSLTAPAAGTVTSTVSVTATATDNVGVVGVQFLLDGVNLGAEDTSSPYSVSWDSLTATNGAHTLTAVARDAAGNVTTSTAVTVTVDNDTTAPTVSITAPAAGPVSGTVSVTADAADNVGVVGVQFKLDGVNLGSEDTVAPYSLSWDTLTATNGSHALTAVARDAAGNVTTSTAVTVTVDNDTTAPTVSLTAPAAGTVTGTVSVTATATDNVGVAGVQFRLDGVNLGSEDTAAPYSLSWDTVTATNGVHTLTAVARDAAGNVTTSAQIAVTVDNAISIPDTTAPTVSLTAPAAGTVSGTISVSATATDNVGVAGVQFQLDGANLGSEDTTSPFSLSWDTMTATDGNHTLTAVARDAAGNITTSSVVTVMVNNADTTAPTVALTLPVAGTVSGTVSVTADAGDNIGVAGVQFQLDGVNLGAEVTASPYSISWDTTTTVDGSHTLTAVARDAAGNITTSSAVSVTVNNDLSVGTSGGGGGGGGSIGLSELALMLMVAFGAIARNKSGKEKSDNRIV